MLIKPSFSALQKKVSAGESAQLWRKRHRTVDRHDATDDDAVNLAVGQGGFICFEKAIDQKMAAQTLGVQGLEMIAVNRLANVHGLPLGWHPGWVRG